MKLPSLAALKNLKFPGGARRASGLVCINLWPDRVDVLHAVTAGGARPEILRCDYYRRVGGEAAVLRRLRRELKLEQYRCATLLRRGDYQIVPVEAPNVLPTELKNAVRWRVRDMIDFPVEEATVDAVSIPGTEGPADRPAQLFAVAARNSIIASAIKPFSDADIPLEIIDVPEFAQRNVARWLEPEGRGVALLSLDEGGGLLTFTSGGELYQHRRIDVTLSSLRGAGPLELNASEELHLEEESPHERLALELQRSLDHFDRQFPRIALAKLVITPVAGADKLRAYLSERIDLPVELLDLLGVLDFHDIVELHDPARQVQCLHAIGAALREETP